jgi:hypothetical protein
VTPYTLVKIIHEEITMENIDSNPNPNPKINAKEHHSKNDDEDLYEDDGNISSFLPVYHVKIKHFSRPIILALCASGLLAWLSYMVVGVAEIIPEDNALAGLMNGVFFTITAAASSILIYFAVKKKGEAALKYLMGGSFLLLTFMLLIFFGDIAYAVILTDELTYVIVSTIHMIISGILSIYLIYMFLTEKMGPKLKNIYVMIIGILIGAFLAIIFPTWTAITMLMGISIWDIISVKKGPIRKIMELTGGIDPDYEKNRLDPAHLNVQELSDISEIEIGVGDLAFYSMLTAHSLTATGNILVALMAAIGILFGSYLTIRELKHNKILPGLPLSIFLGLGFAIISALIAGQFA